jgi:hypothetical protein
VSRSHLLIPRFPVALLAAAALAAALLVADPVAAEASPAKPAGVVAGYSGEQLANARVIVGVAVTRRLPVAAAILGVAAAMGESSLRNLPYGDNAINPDGTVADSIGLFQQQHWWGSRAERMTPSYAAGAFFAHLVRVHGWQGMTPTAAIHAVQGNADRGFYSRFVPAAIEVVRHIVAHPGAVGGSSSRSSGTGPKKGSAARPPAITIPKIKIPTITIPTITVPPITAPDSIPSTAAAPPGPADEQALTAGDLGLDSLDSIDLGDWPTGWDLGDVDDSISGAFTDGLGSAGGTLPDSSGNGTTSDDAVPEG